MMQRAMYIGAPSAEDVRTITTDMGKMRLRPATAKRPIFLLLLLEVDFVRYGCGDQWLGPGL